jgi:hypothetical protein
MSASDYIKKKKFQSMGNKFTSKDSGNIIAQSMINTIRNTVKRDSYGDVFLPTWFDIPISNQEMTDISNSSIASLTITAPLVTEPPLQSNTSAVKIKDAHNQPNPCGGDFPPQEFIYDGHGQFIPGVHAFVSCQACGISMIDMLFSET